MEKRDLIGLTARDTDGAEIGRITKIVVDEEMDSVTYVVIESQDGDETEVPISAVEADEEADFATFHADRSDEEPGDHTGDEETPDTYAPGDMIDEGSEDTETSGQFVSEANEEGEVQPPQEIAREDWQDEADTPDSGYPMNDTYVDPEDGEQKSDPAMRDNQTTGDDVEELLELLSDTELSVVSSEGGVVLLSGNIASREDLSVLEDEILGLDGVVEVDTTDVEIAGG